MTGKLTVLTGAFGYSGRYIARRLLDRGECVRTLTSRPVADSPFGDRIEARPFHFDDPERLVESLRGADALINTYWVRFDHGEATYERAVANTRRLIDAASRAGVRRIVHVSIANPTEDSPLPYFCGKAHLEREIRECGLSYAIIRPTVLFGREDILVNNIAWLLRRLPVFGLPGLGRYPVQPVFVDDLASLAVEQAGGGDDVTLDAVGPETFTFAEMVRLVRDAVGVRTPVVPMPKSLVYMAGKAMGRLVKDVVLTWQEVRGLTAGLLVSHDTPTCPTRFTDWLGAHGGGLGRAYASELARHWRTSEAVCP
jgi:uncharacterized protein YbjT (DUF2867 family)